MFACLVKLDSFEEGYMRAALTGYGRMCVVAADDVGRSRSKIGCN